MEIDTGASKMILNEASYQRLRDALGPLQTTMAVLTTYTGEKIPVLGTVMVPVKYEGQHKNSAVGPYLGSIRVQDCL